MFYKKPLAYPGAGLVKLFLPDGIVRIRELDTVFSMADNRPGYLFFLQLQKQRFS